ncbi:MAG: RuvA C-terminal domain-containing protein [Nitrososphaerales archaeon]
MNADFSQILPAGHPSFGTARAVFLFSIAQGQRVLVVEATNPWAVLCLERLLLVDGKVSDFCHVLTVIRDFRNVGMRSDTAEEVPFMDFMTDIVDPYRLAGGVDDDGLILKCFKEALTPEELEVAGIKLDAMAEAPTPYNFMQFAEGLSESVPALPAAETGPDQADQLTSALVNLGFKKPEVRRFVSALGDRTRSESMHALIREGLRQLAA